MSAPSRSAQFVKLHKVLKKSYTPISPNPDRPVLEHLLYGCCLEDAHYEKADEAYATLVHTFFDWNEIRVTTIKELAEVLGVLPDPAAAANRAKRVLQSVFEASYSFDLEELRKKNLGPAIERLQKIAGTTPFTVAYVVQSTLGGHSIPIDAATIAVMKVMDLVSDKDAEQGVVPGLERAIPKNKGIEFGSMLHQLGADYLANPYLPALHKILVQVDPEVEKRLPKRRARTQAAAAEAPASAAEPKSKGRAKAEPAAAAEKAPTTRKKKGADEATPPVETPKGRAKEKDVKGKDTESAAANESKPVAAKKPAATKRPADASSSAEAESSPSKRSTAAGLAKKKPR
jgi:endonuclease-3